MLYIKKFIDRIAYLESRQVKDFTMPLSDAKMLRDEVTKILLDITQQKSSLESVVEVQVKGRSFK
jgi:hypothetical protein